ncbi:MAG: mechanosensitive ion channel [Clostridia bacterium]|nr:mechanosensitive ion channel [Clostridia bacterium]
MSAVWNYLKQLPYEKAIMTVILTIVCLFAVKVILKFFDKFIKRSKIDALVAKILRLVFKIFLLFTVVTIVLSSIGISVSSLVAAISIVGVAFSLAIQDFLSNVFGGIQIVSNHPFKVGDYVDAGGESGTVREVGLFYTKLDTPDKKLVQIPNSKIANGSIINYSNSPIRRLEFLVAVTYDNEVEKVREVLVKLLNEHPLVLQEEGKTPVAHVKEFKESDILYTARAWCENQNYWTIYFDIMDSIQSTFEKNGVSFTYPHVNVHMITK